MTVYRIVEEYDSFGSIYKIQKRFLYFFWEDLSVWNYEKMWRQWTFSTQTEAENAISKIIRIEESDKKREESRGKRVIKEVHHG